jgi:predicted ATP-grasp superfamily ATP-dependent carboligase
MARDVGRRRRVVAFGRNPALALKVIYCLSTVAEVHLCFHGSNNYAARSRHVSRAYRVDLDRDSPREVLARLNGIVRDCHAEVVFPTDMETTAYLHALRLEVDGAAVVPTVGGAVLKEIHNKWSFALRLQAAGLATPKTTLLANRGDLRSELVAQVGFPVVVKPLDCESSHGVVRFNSFAELAEYVESGRRYSEPPLILQSFAPGRDVDISVMAQGGRILASACQEWTPHGTLRFSDDSEMLSLAAAIVELFEFSGPAHFDMRRDPETGRLVVLECNPRYWYTIPAALWSGLNFAEVGIRVALGLSIDGLGPARGEYRLPGDVVRALAHPRRLLAMSTSNWRGFLQPVRDPVPQFYQLFTSS